MAKFMGIVILAAASVMMFACSDQQEQTSQKSAKESQSQQQAEQAAAPSEQAEVTEQTTPTNLKQSEKTLIEIQTSKGNIVVELNAEKAPISVENFLSYVDDGQYEGTIFHRVISNFMIQGGGFTEDMQQKATKAQIKNEADNGLSNTRGTIAMARTNIVDSATCQFFINVKDNEFLNHQAKTAQEYGYCVFGEVTEGMDVVDAIKSVATTTKQGMGDVPVEAVIIERIVRK